MDIDWPTEELTIVGRHNLANQLRSWSQVIPATR